MIVVVFFFSYEIIYKCKKKLFVYFSESSPTTPTPAPSTSSKPTNSTSASSSSSAAGNIGEKPEHRRMMLVGFSMARGSTLQEIESTVPILTLVLYWLDRIKRLRLSREVCIII